MVPAEVVASQRKDWNRVAPAWEKWDSLLAERWIFLNHVIVGQARLRPGGSVLDIGCGTGHPALLAAQVVGRQGRVVGVDLAEKMVQAAQRKAEALGLSQLSFQTADASELPFEEGSFDAVISRFCFMFVPEADKALSGVRRLLKKRGYCVLAVWSAPEKNPYLKMPVDVVRQFVEVPVPGPDDPGLFRFAQPGRLASLAEKAGLRVVNEEEFTGEMHLDSADQYFSSLMEIAAPLQALFARLTPDQNREAGSKIKSAAEGYRLNSHLELPFAVRLLTARKD